MTIQRFSSANKLFPKIKHNEVTPENISNKMDDLEENLFNAQFSDHVPAENLYYLIDAKKMLLFARENYAKGFFHVSIASLLLAKNYIERCGIFENRPSF